MRLLLTLLVLVVIAGAGIYGLGNIPPQDWPFAPLDLEDPVGLATGMKLSRLRNKPEQCMAVLDRSQLQAEPIADRSTGAFCGFHNAVAVERSSVAYGGPALRATCALAAALYVWEREVVAPAARQYLGGKVSRITHVGTYACRRVNGSASGRPSQHATANAIDITGFRLADGRRVSVLSGWNGSAQQRAFLRAVRDGGCKLFRGVLSPDYNALHRDHFHLDMGPYNICR